MIEFWNVTKNDILICDKCEYRYMCFDEGELIKVSKKKYQRKNECPYNPFISKWNIEKGYLKLHDCGIIIQDGNLIINENILNEINEELYS